MLQEGFLALKVVDKSSRSCPRCCTDICNKDHDIKRGRKSLKKKKKKKKKEKGTEIHGVVSLGFGLLHIPTNNPLV